MRILYFSWGENSTEDMLDSLRNLGHEVSHIESIVDDFLYNELLTKKIAEMLSAEKYDLIFTFDYFPFISNISEKYQVKYASWIYDCPHYTLNSTTIANTYTYIFVFDKLQMFDLKNRGAKNVFYLPLAVNTRRIDKQLEGICGYIDEVSFVGSLYEKNNFSKLSGLSDYTRGYLNAIIEVQRRIYGLNVIGGALDNINEDIERIISIDEEASCPLNKRQVFEDMVLEKVTSDDRVILLNVVSAICELGLYTASDYNLCPKAIHRGTVDYVSQMPKVFRQSKINLNISLRTIQSGIPLRAMDIMGCGGFLLSNYQPELVELFEPGKEFVYYEDEYDLLKKVDYYLGHDEERKAIARCGWEKVNKHFSYDEAIEALLEYIMW